jgi:hypothetical protein
MNARHRGEAHDVVHGQNERTLDQAVDHEPMLARVHVDATGVVALEEQSVRGDDPVHGLQRRETDGGFLARGQPGHVAADDVAFELRRHAVRAVDNAGTDRLRPWRFGGGRGLLAGRGAIGPAERGASRDGSAQAQERTPRIVPADTARRLVQSSVQSLAHRSSLRNVRHSPFTSCRPPAAGLDWALSMSPKLVNSNSSRTRGTRAAADCGNREHHGRHH